MVSSCGPYSEGLRGRVQFGRGEHLAGIEHMWGVGWQHGNVAIETDFFATMVADSRLAALRRVRRKPGPYHRLNAVVSRRSARVPSTACWGVPNAMWPAL